MERQILIMEDPTFEPGSIHAATIYITVEPAGINCTVKLWLTVDGKIEAASGAADFITTGAEQSIDVSVTMPKTSPTNGYAVYLDIVSGGVLIAAYVASEKVGIITTGFISGHVWVAGGTTPVVGATVIVDGSAVATTNTAGGYIIELPVGSHTVTVSASGYNAPTPRTIMVLLGQYADGNFTLTPEMTGYSLIDRVLAGIVGGYVSYIYPTWYNITGSVGSQAYVERYGQSHSVSWRWGATTLKFPNGTVKSVYVSNGRFYDVSTGTPTVLNQAGQYYVRMQLESTMDGVNWYVSDDKNIKLCYLS